MLVEVCTEITLVGLVLAESTEPARRRARADREHRSRADLVPGTVRRLVTGEPAEGIPDRIAVAHHDGVHSGNRAEDVSHPVEDLARRLAASDRDVRIRPIDIGDRGASGDVAHALKPSERLLPEPAVQARRKAQTSADDLRGLHRSDQIAAKQQRRRAPSPLEIGRHKPRRSRRLSATQLSQGRMNRLTLGALLHIPHRLPVPDQIEH
ncbi:MAG: hypothetical protein M3140_07265 [Actinomycetota bacterium]|nr:hypothetical protein [Actinomycetota bacterium]